MNFKKDKHRAYGNTNIPIDVIRRFKDDTLADIYLAECHSSYLDEQTFDSLCHVLAERIALSIGIYLKE